MNVLVVELPSSTSLEYLEWFAKAILALIVFQDYPLPPARPGIILWDLLRVFMNQRVGAVPLME